MLTKGGPAQRLLICTDCSLPVDDRESSLMARQRLWGGLTLVGMALLSAAMFLLANMYERRTAGTVEGALERQAESAGGEGGDENNEQRALFEPSGLVKPRAPEQLTAPKGEGVVSGGARGAPGATGSEQPAGASVSAKPERATVSTKQDGATVSSKPEATSTSTSAAVGEVILIAGDGWGSIVG